MNQWALRRKRIVLSIVLFIIAVIVAIPIYISLSKPPTCFDNKMNGDESGIDCGGSCSVLCVGQALPLIVKGDPRILSLGENTYEAVALLTNPNASGQVYRASYTFALYSKDDPTPLKTISGSVFIPKGKDFGIFQGPFIITEGVPTRATLTLHEDEFIWDKNTDDLPELIIKDSKLSSLDKEPRLSASIENPTLEKALNVELITFIYDERGNIIAASKTFIDSLSAGESAPVLFGWSKPFIGQATTFDIVYRLLPDKSFIK